MRWPGNAWRDEQIDRYKTDLAFARNQIQDDLTIMAAKNVLIAKLETKLEYETIGRAKAENDYARLEADFKALAQKVAIQGRPNVRPEFDRDPFAEDLKQAEVFLTPSPEEEMGINLRPEYLTTNGPEASEAGVAD